MPPHKRRRACTPRGTSSPTAAVTLPAELILEIAARSEADTLFRCAAACKLSSFGARSSALRLSVASAERRTASCRRGFSASLTRHSPSSTPSTPAAASFAEESLAPFVSRSAADLLEQEYEALVVLERSESDMCVYDPMTGGRTFLPLPPDVGRDDHLYTTCTYVLLTAADGIGIGCSFLLLAADLAGLHQPAHAQGASVCRLCRRTLGASGAR
ncbi:hypothetical protein SETIT_9G301600v2 [Setaria italica]|uniref:Uncharacterized protein n=1 Tax=Setaria italica TaxID=4555 RepID=A0A368SME1_SETIT|nr:hypothetical protein SETIT_9G301600v2 [Setaria italica]